MLSVIFAWQSPQHAEVVHERNAPLLWPLKVVDLNAVCGQWATAGGDPCEFEKCLAMTKPFFHLKATRLEPRVGGGLVWDGMGCGWCASVRAQAALFPSAWPAATFNGSFMRVRLELSLRAFSIMKKCTSAEFSNDINVDDRRRSGAELSQGRQLRQSQRKWAKAKFGKWTSKWKRQIKLFLMKMRPWWQGGQSDRRRSRLN